MLTKCKARCTFLNNKTTESASTFCWICNREHGINLCVFPVCDPLFCSVKHPFVAIKYSGRFHTECIRTGICFCQTECCQFFSCSDIRKILLLLSITCEKENGKSSKCSCSHCKRDTAAYL